MIKKLFLILFLLSLPCEAAKKPVIITTSCPQGQTTMVYAGCNVLGKFGVKPYAFSLVAPLNVLPTGLSLNTVNSVGQITGTPTVVGTTQFKVRLTDSGGPPKTFDQTLYISIIATPVPPSNPVVITTNTPLPAGLVDSTYLTKLQATGGNGTYGWSVTSGALPAGLGLNGSTGEITGTPTAATTAYFTITSTDTSTVPSSAKQNYYLNIVNPVPAPTNLFADSFESGNFSAWTSVYCGSGGLCPTIATTPVHAGTYSFGQEFSVCGDSTNVNCGAAHQDFNRYITKSFADFGYPTGTNHFWMRGWVYFKTPEADATTGKIIQRKMIRLTDAPLGFATYEVLLAGWSGSGGLPTTDTRLSLSCYCGAGGAFTTTFDLATIPYDTYTRVKIEVLLNTPGVADGAIRIYVGTSETPVYTNTAIAVRNTKTTNITTLSLGAQVDRTTYFTIHEFRYWDDVVINNADIVP